MEVKELKTLVKLVKGKKPKSLSETKTKTHSEPYLLAQVIRGNKEPKFGKGDEMVVVSPNDLLIISDGDAGEVFQGLSGGLASTMSKIELLENINLSYLKYFLISNRKFLSDTRTGAAIPHLNKDIFFNLKIPVPSLQEQEKIVERLDEVFENIDKLTEDLTKSIKNSKNLFFSFLNETFRGNGSEDLIELEKLSTYISRGLQPKYTDKSKTLVINQRCIRDNQINFEVGRYHDQSIKKVSDDKKIQIGDILINSTGVGTLGRVAQVTELPSSDVTVDTHVTIFRPNFNILNKEFTNWLFIYLENLIEKMGVGASGQTELRREDLKNMKIINPPNEKIQQNISDKLNNLKNLYDNYLKLKEDLIIKYSMLRKSILDKEFSYE